MRSMLDARGRFTRPVIACSMMTLRPLQVVGLATAALAAVAAAVKAVAPRPVPQAKRALKLSGLEPMAVA